MIAGPRAQRLRPPSSARSRMRALCNCDFDVPSEMPSSSRDFAVLAALDVVQHEHRPAARRQRRQRRARDPADRRRRESRRRWRPCRRRLLIERRRSAARTAPACCAGSRGTGSSPSRNSHVPSDDSPLYSPSLRCAVRKISCSRSSASVRPTSRHASPNSRGACVRYTSSNAPGTFARHRSTRARSACDAWPRNQRLRRASRPSRTAARGWPALALRHRHLQGQSAIRAVGNGEDAGNRQSLRVTEASVHPIRVTAKPNRRDRATGRRHAGGRWRCAYRLPISRSRFPGSPAHLP